MKPSYILVALAALFVATAARAAGEPPAQIPFLKYGGIQDWRAESRNALIIKSLPGKFYRVTFLAPCIELPFAQAIAFVTDSLGTLDRFDSIIVRGHRCYFKDLVEIAKPARW